MDIFRRARRFLNQPPRERLHPGGLDKAMALQLGHISSDARLFATRKDYIASLPKGGVCVEVGVAKGDFSAYIIETAKPQKLHLIDVDLSRFGLRQRFANYSNIEWHEGDSAKMLGTFDENYFDWIYVDGDHSYEKGARRHCSRDPQAQSAWSTDLQRLHHLEPLAREALWRCARGE